MENKKNDKTVRRQTDVLPKENMFQENKNVSKFLDKFPKEIRNKNIIPIFDKNKKGYAPKNPGYSWKEYQKKKYPIKKLIRKQINNYALICGDPLRENKYLIVVDMDNQLFFEYFENDETLITKTPNGGYHAYYYSIEPVDKRKRFLKLPLDIQGIGSYVMIPPSSYNQNFYEIVKNKPIKTVQNVKDYVKNKLPKSLINIEKIENQQPNDIKQFKKQLHEKFSLLDIIKEHFPDWYEPQEIREHGNVIRLFNPIKKQESDSPSFVIFEETQSWYSHSSDESGDVIDFIKRINKESRLDHALQYLQLKYGIKAPTLKAKKENKIDIDDIDDFFRKTEKNDKNINHGMFFNDIDGLIYASVYSGGIKGIFGISRNKLIKALQKFDTIKKEPPENVYICKGYKQPLNERTLRAIRDLSHQIHINGNFAYNNISELFDSVLQNTQVYLELKNQNEHYFFVLWVLGTYLRAIFVWFPYITFYGLRDVGKSTALTLLSNLCFNGSGYISGSSSEALLFRKASATKGFFTIDHYEEVRKSNEKKQVITQYLESAWYLYSTIDRVNKDNHGLEQFNVASSVAIGTRDIDDVLEEKGIIIQMVETSDKDKRRNSAKIHKDPYFQTIQQKCMATSLMYQDEIIKAYENIGDIEGLEGRDYNKFLPILALSKVIDNNNNIKYDLYDLMVSYAIEYRKKRKDELNDTEEILLKIILEEKIENTTYNKLSELMTNEIENYNWQRAKSDLKKLQIIKRIHKTKPVKIEINLEKATNRAESRGIKIELQKSNTENFPYLKVEDKTNKKPKYLKEPNYEDIPLLDNDSIKDNEITESYTILIENGSIALKSFVDKLEIKTDSSHLRCWGAFNYLKDKGYIDFKSEGWIQATNKFRDLQQESDLNKPNEI
ncbi:bifunctional DNA primase/polymerase [Methanobacterium spitsbergense]|uniref:Bifunctional DNA primase/polymerase n=1 Tax=Methanobacterium spitsbergense TaxID=2874285 RepID=A0A8T5V0V2_9EURY|nr:bifunctional DNA primase/polymerase [Methanobacterium spitsbergense]MBZ2166653.1 bifunctional DNA primase/polymerase [Methanobacterium spitsbergense]